MEHQTLGRLVIRPSDPANQRIILKIVGFFVFQDNSWIENENLLLWFRHCFLRQRARWTGRACYFLRHNSANQLFREKPLFALRFHGSTYTAGINVWSGSFLTVNHHNHKNWVPSILANDLWLTFMGVKQKIISFLKKKFKMADSKKLSFSKLPILKILLWKFHGFLGGV